MKFRPCIDLHHGVVKQIVGSTLKDDPDALPVTNFESTLSSAEYARMYQSDDLLGGHIIKLGAGNDEAAMSALATFPGGMQIGGGVTPENAKAFIDAGASHVIVTSYVFRDGRIDYSRMEELVSTVGKERLVLDLSCRKRKKQDETSSYFVVTDRWQKFTDFEVSAVSLQELSQYCAEFLVHGVDVEGMRCGIEAELVALLGKHSPIPVTYAGGAVSLEDLDTVNQLGGGRVDLTIGSALDIFGGDVPYRDVVAWHKAHDL